MKKRKFLVVSGPVPTLPSTSQQPANDIESSLDDIHRDLKSLAGQLDVDVECLQFDNEGDMVDCLHKANTEVDGVIVNAGALAYDNRSLTAAIETIESPCLEVFVSSLRQREEMPRQSLIAPVCEAIIGGFGKRGYLLGLEALARFWQNR